MVNIPGNHVDRGETLSAYIGSAPPSGTGLHRYVFLIYRQSLKIDFKEKRLPNKYVFFFFTTDDYKSDFSSTKGRGGFSIKKFAGKYKMGSPIAANFFVAQWDEYVPLLYKQFVD